MKTGLHRRPTNRRRCGMALRTLLAAAGRASRYGVRSAAIWSSVVKGYLLGFSVLFRPEPICLDARGPGIYATVSA